MQEHTIRKILEDEDNLDLLKAAEAVLEKSLRDSKKKIPNRWRAFNAWQKVKAQYQADEAFRQQLAEVWKKRKLGVDKSP